VADNSKITPLDERPRSGPYGGLNINSAKRFLTKQFEQAELATPDIDARLLVMAATGFNRSELIANGTDFLSQDAFTKISEFADRRLSGEPVDHILAKREFYGRNFHISKDVLSPRPDTECLIDQALPFLENLEHPKILELGSGTGAIILTLLAECEGATGIAADISKHAINMTQKNASALGLSKRLNIIESDWFSHVEGNYDLIISNPPYIDEKAMTELSPEVKNYDPHLALFGGIDGLNPYRVIARDGHNHLNTQGALILEIGFDQAIVVRDILKQNNWQNITLFQDLAGQDRCLLARP